MLYAIYRKATPFQLILVIVAMIVLWFAGFSRTAEAVCHPQLSLLCAVFDNFNLWLGGLPARILALLLLLGSGFLLTLSLSANHLIARQTYFPALILPLFASYSLPLQVFHMVIPALVLLIASLHFLLTAYEKADMTKDLFTAGMFTSLAALIYFPAIAFGLLPFLALLIYRNFDWRQWGATFAGLFAPLLYLFSTAYFLYGGMHIREFLHAIEPDLRVSLPSHHWTMYIFWGLQAVLLLRALASVVWHAQERVISYRKRNLIMMWFLFISQLSLFLAGPAIGFHSILIFIPVSFYLTYFFFDRGFRRKWLADLLIYMLLFSLALTIAQEHLAAA
ncbi:MAG TPA: hypothetical protein P5550_03650 [Bacteroidales bacterium]|nr:hypothetical protein [Bacteroidales bacterium]HRZ76062.1 hypothetical protein [Bacteroidales bacterium]